MGHKTASWHIDDTRFKEKFGNQLRYWIEENNLIPADVARRMSPTPSKVDNWKSKISNWCTGKHYVDVEHHVNLARAIGVPLDLFKYVLGMLRSHIDIPLQSSKVVSVPFGQERPTREARQRRSGSH